MIRAAIVLFVTLFVFAGCGGDNSRDFTRPASAADFTPPTGWARYEGRNSALWLPDTFESRDLESDQDDSVDLLLPGGGEDPSNLDMFAVDTGGGAGVLIMRRPVPLAFEIDVLLTTMERSLPAAWDVTLRETTQRFGGEVGILEITQNEKAVRQRLYVRHIGKYMWAITFGSREPEFDGLKQSFETSFRSFEYLSD